MIRVLAALLVLSTAAHGQKRPTLEEIMRPYDVITPPRPPGEAEPVKPEPVQPEPPIVIPGADQRLAYATDLRRRFLSGGTDMNVLVFERALSGPDPDPVPHPALFLDGWFNSAIMYRLVSDGILVEAKRAGFLGVIFLGRRRGGIWQFDLTGATAPTCTMKRGWCL